MDAAPQQQRAEKSFVGLGVIHREARLLHEPADIGKKLPDLFIVEMTLGNRKYRLPFARLVESDRRAFVEVNALPLFLLCAHGGKSEGKLELVSVVIHLRTRNNFEDAAGKRGSDVFIHRRKMRKRLADDVLLVRNLLVVGQVLPLASAAIVEVLAAGHDLVFAFRRIF